MAIKTDNKSNGTSESREAHIPLPFRPLKEKKTKNKEATKLTEELRRELGNDGLQQEADDAAGFHGDGRGRAQLLQSALLLHVPRFQRVEQAVGRAHQRHGRLDAPASVQIISFVLFV